MSSKTDLCNRALTFIGVATIAEIAEASTAARSCNAIFDDLLDEELAAHPWNFALDRAQLAAEAAAPGFEYDYAHPLPSDPYCLVVVKEYNGYEFIVEGRKALSNDTPLQIQYIKRVTDLTALSAQFKKAFVYRLATELAIPLQKSGKLRDRMAAEYYRAIALARVRDAQEGTPPEQAAGSWLESSGLDY